MKAAKHVPVERKIRRLGIAPRTYQMRYDEDLDDVLDQEFGAHTYASATPKDAPLVGRIITHRGKELSVYREEHA